MKRMNCVFVRTLKSFASYGRNFALTVLVASVTGMQVFASESQEQAQELELQDLQEETTSSARFWDNVRIYGFARNYFAYDTRESYTAAGELHYYVPKDVNYNAYGEDLNAISSLRFLSVASRLGFESLGYTYGRTTFGGKLEADFAGGMSGSGGSAYLRIRQLYLTAAWKDLWHGVQLKVGHAVHPMAEDEPSVFSFEGGNPFNTDNRSPMAMFDAKVGRNLTVTAGALMQMLYPSMGPDGSSTNYIKYATTPEGYLGLTYNTDGGFLAKAGVSVLSLKPRVYGTVYDTELLQNVQVTVSDRVTSVSPFLFLQYEKNGLVLRAKTNYSAAGDHLSFMTGYGIAAGSYDNADGHYDYVPLRMNANWVSVSYGKKWQFSLMAGYLVNLGTAKPLVTDLSSYYNDNNEYVEVDLVSASNVYFSENATSNLKAAWRVLPSVLYNMGNFTLGLELNVTSAQYGDYVQVGGQNYLYASNGLATDNLHWVTNCRVQVVAMFTL